MEAAGQPEKQTTDYKENANMSKMSELSALLDNLMSCGETLAETGRALKDFYSNTDEPEPPAKPRAKEKKAPATETEPETSKEETQHYSKEDVRGILAAKASEAGGRFRTEVKAIVRKYGNGGSLTDVPTEHYPDLVKEVEGLTDG